MSIWAIADIHASRTDPATGGPFKPMEVFGEQWADHITRLEAAWQATVDDADTVIVAGDIDWALRLDDALETLNRIDRLPGRKVLVRGNHDYWWSSKSTSKVRKVLPESMTLLHNNAIQSEGFNICGTKGSPVPGGMEWTDENTKLLARERLRLEASLAARDPDLPTIAALHYPPFFPPLVQTSYVSLLLSSGVQACVYGHLHGAAAASGPQGPYGGVHYMLVAGDYTGFAPTLVASQGKVACSQGDLRC